MACQAPSYQTLKKRMDISFPPTLAGGQLLTKQIQIDNNSNMIIPRTLHYFEPVQLMAGLLRDSDIMQHFVCHPQVKLTTCGERIYDEVISYLVTTCPYVDSNYTILLQDFYCRLPFEDPNKSYDIWVHGLGMTKVYFQIGMIIGDTEEHNKICGFRGDNGFYRQYVCRDCLAGFK